MTCRKCNEEEKRQWIEEMRAKARQHPERARRLLAAIMNICPRCGGELDEEGHEEQCAEREAELDIFDKRVDKDGTPGTIRKTRRTNHESC